MSQNDKSLKRDVIKEEMMYRFNIISVFVIFLALAMALPQMVLAQGAGKALDFDGTDDYVTVPDAANLDISSNITIEMWAKKTATDYGTPTGTPITNVTELQNMKNNLTANYYLANDIDASATSTWNSDGAGGYYGFEPIGNSTTKYTGTFDGQGYKITNLYINRGTTNYVGLFGYVDTGGEIKNVGLINPDVTGNAFVGALAGYCKVSVTNCYSAGSSGSVTGNDQHIGGLVGYWYGYGTSSTITDCYSTCNVTIVGDYNPSVGGLLGRSFGGTVTKCFSTGDVSGTGGFPAGGFVGMNLFSTISNCYATGDVSGSGQTGGFVGKNSAGIITNCYSTGSVLSTSSSGGFCALNSNTITSCYWDTQTSGQATSDGGTGKTTAQMKQQATFSGWDFTDTWGIEEDASYPFMQWQWDYTGSKGRDAYSLQFNREGTTLYGYISGNEVTASVSDPTDWHHYAMTFDGTSQKLYIDGVLKTTTTPGGTIGTNNNTFDIGGAFKGYFGGKIDEMRIWNVALTQAQIREMMCKKINSGNLPSGLSWSNLKGYWRFDESTGTTVYDQTSNDNDGTMINMDPATDRVYSGAPIGDESHYESGAGASIETGDNLDITVTLYGASANTILYGTETNERPTNNGTLPSGVVNLAPRYWDVKATNIDSARIRFYWTGLPGINDENTLKLLKRDNESNNSWTDITSSATRDTANNYFQITETSFSQYVIAGGSDNTLPVELSSFMAQFVDNVPLLCWTTATETDNLGFNIYRGESEDAYLTGQTFKINPDMIEGAGTTSQPTEYSFRDKYDVIANTTYWYWLESIDYSGLTDIYRPVSLTIPEEYNDNTPEIPNWYGLAQNYPNPFNPNTEIRFRMIEDCFGELTIYNIKGEKLITLFKGDILKDVVNTIFWNGKDESGKEVGSGIYFYKLITREGAYSEKMILLR